jgi:hypothetical protein
MEKSTWFGIGIFVIVSVIGLFIVNGNAVTGNVVGIDSQKLSGNIVGLDPNRAMAGAPCHFMGGQVMGDCDTREINLEVWKYDWSEPTITVKSGEAVRIKASSRDTSHGFAIPEIGFNLRIDPGKTSVGEFVAPEPGEYAFGCSVMCGSGHGSHRGKLVVI